MWKIRHKPTGLFYCKGQYIKGSKIKTNLTVTGKLYCQRPSLLWIKDGYKDTKGVSRKYDRDDFEIIKL